MQITISPIAGLPGATETQASVGANDVLTVNGVPHDLSAIPDGGFTEPTGEHPFIGRIERTGGELRLTLLWHYDTATAEPVQPSTAPVLTVTDGAVPDPIVRNPEASP